MRIVIVFAIPVMLSACDVRREHPIPPAVQSVESDRREAPDAVTSGNVTSPVLASTAATTSPTAAVVGGDDDMGRPQACSALGFVSAKWISEDHFEVQRRDIDAIVNSLREYGRTLDEDQLVVAKSASGQQGLRVLGVGPKAACGLESDDILLSVNEIPVSDRAVLAKRREQLTRANEVKLTLERDQKVKVITYSIR